MNLAIKGALFNALIFPGWGQLYLKKYKKGILIIIAISAGVISILWSVAQATINILKIAPFKKGTITSIAVVQLAIDAVKALNLFYLSWILFFMILLWILSIIDAYMTGKKEMVKATTAADQQSISPEV
jgi:TM2 domain-containing membrane protein YozV